MLPEIHVSNSRVPFPPVTHVINAFSSSNGNAYSRPWPALKILWSPAQPSRHCTRSGRLCMILFPPKAHDRRHLGHLGTCDRRNSSPETGDFLGWRPLLPERMVFRKSCFLRSFITVASFVHPYQTDNCLSYLISDPQSFFGWSHWASHAIRLRLFDSSLTGSRDIHLMWTRLIYAILVT